MSKWYPWDAKLNHFMGQMRKWCSERWVNLSKVISPRRAKAVTSTQGSQTAESSSLCSNAPKAKGTSESRPSPNLKREVCRWPRKSGPIWEVDVQTFSQWRNCLRQPSIRVQFSFKKSNFITRLGSAFFRESPVMGVPCSKCKNAWFVFF